MAKRARTQEGCILLAVLGMWWPHMMAGAAEHFVVKDNPGAEAPFSSWDTAAPDIQSAINVAISGSVVWVADEVYDAGEHLSSDEQTNRVVIGSGITVQSLNGPELTVILGEGGVRCVALGAGARLSGFSLTEGLNAGGAWCEDVSAVISNCFLFNNSTELGGGARGGTLTHCDLHHNTADTGGGAYDSLLRHCRIFGNTADYGGGLSGSEVWNSQVFSNTAVEAGGGVHDSVLYSCLLEGNTANTGGGASESAISNCTVTGNRAGTEGGGVYSGSLQNSVVYFNTLTGGTTNNWTNALFSFSCTTPLPDGEGNLSEDPLFLGPGNYRLHSGSPCINAGTNQGWMTGASDLDGHARILDGIVDMGAYEFEPPPLPQPLLVVLGTNFESITHGEDPRPEVGTLFVASQGQGLSHVFSVTNPGNTTVEFTSWSLAGTGTNAFSVFGFPAQLDPGASLPFTVVFQALTAHTYEAQLLIHHTASNAVSPFELKFSGIGVLPVFRYVVQGNAGATPPYTNWASAASNIQSALDASLQDDTIWVSNGVYDSGGQAVSESITNRAALVRPVTLQSVNGPEVTFIVGAEGVRPAYLTEGSVLSGFTLTNGLSVGGAWCAGRGALISNCVLTGNSGEYGGGTAGGTLRNCQLTGNAAEFGGGAFDAALYDCQLYGNTAVYGGGVANSEAVRCIFYNNLAEERGGGSSLSTLYNCVLYSNSAAYGGGASGDALINCTLYENMASTAGGGISEGELKNCIAYYNTLNGVVLDNWDSAQISYSCTLPQPPGVGNMDAEPLFMNRAENDLRLQPASPCINTGENQSWMTNTTDIAGNPRILRAVVDLGALEYNGIPLEWLVEYNLPTDGTADTQDPDTDHMSNWEEWVAGTHPTNGLSYFMLQPQRLPREDGAVFQWLSATGRVYALQASTNLNHGFQPLENGIPATPPLNIHTSEASSASFQFLRLEVSTWPE